MTSKAAYYAGMAKEGASWVTGSMEKWTDFLASSARHYKYSYPEQLLIFVQRPEATACAEYDFWNDKMNRYIKRGSKGIALVDNSGEEPRLRYVFDVSDTGTRKNSRPVYLWKMQEEYRPAVKQALAEAFGVRESSALEDEVMELSERMAGDYWEEHKEQIRDIVADSFLEGYDELNVGVAFKRAAASSIAYTILTRTTEDAGSFFEHEDFLNVFDFNTQAAANVLGTAVSEQSSQVFRKIERTIRTYERNKQAERSQNYDRVDVQAERGLSDSGNSAGNSREEDAGEIRQDAQSLSSGEQHSPV